MSQEPINIAGVCAFPNPNGVRDKEERAKRKYEPER